MVCLFYLRDDLVPWTMDEFVKNFQKLTLERIVNQKTKNLKP